MTSSRLLIPLRIPELGPALGKLVVGTGRESVGLSLDGFRRQLTNRLFDAAGEARRLASNGEREAALGAIGREVWLSGWDDAVGAVAAALVVTIGDRLEAEARAVRMPKRLRRRLQLDVGEQRALSARLGSSGAGLVGALSVLAQRSKEVVSATAMDRPILEDWQAALAGAARQSEASWIALEAAVDTELDHWGGIANDVAQWRRPLWPVVTVGLAGSGIAAWIGALYGGVLPMPSWIPDALLVLLRR